MIEIQNVSPLSLGWMLSWMAIILFMLCYIFIRFIQQKRNIAYSILTVIIFLIDYMMMQYIMYIVEQVEYGMENYPRQWFETMPVFGVILTLFIITLIAGYEQYIIGRWNKTHITPFSIKESIDMLPEGVCYYWQGGLPKLINGRMEELCWKITGNALSDGEAFWNTLQSGEMREGIVRIQSEERPMIQLSDGNVYSFQRNELMLENHPLVELISVNITKEYHIGLQLQEKQKKADEINRRLKKLNHTITQMTIEKEVLETKIQVHDNLGRALLLANRYLSNPESTDKEEMLKLWKRNIMLLKNERPEEWQDSYVDSFRAAALLGVAIKTNGELPEEEHARKVVDFAIHTCLTNTIRHAEGTEMYITSMKAGDTFLLDFQNNGMSPKEEIKETGGLKNLRREVEGIGGTMRIQSTPQYVLTITIPKEKN